jgi:tetratricopeptide (TPR) repeat protein
MDAFNPLITYDKENPYSEYSSFYYGLSAQKLGYTSLAKQTFLQIEKLYPQWIATDEVRFQLSALYFKQGDFFLALKELNQIKDSSAKRESISMMQYFLKRIDDVETLRLLHEEYRQDSVIARQMAKAISEQGYAKEYKKLFDSLLLQFDFNKNDFHALPTETPFKKKQFRVSVLFPFLLSTLDPSPNKKKNQFVIDLYQGMMLALDTLEKRGINIDLLAYDTQRNLDTLQRIIKSGELQSSDLLVGPLFTEEFGKVIEYSIKNKIPMINPVTNNSEYTAKNKLALLYQPSYTTLGVKAAEYSLQNSINKTCMVFYGDTQKDSAMAESFLKKANELGLKITLSQQVNKESAPKILEILATPVAFDQWHNPIQFKLKRNSIGCIYVASDNPLIFSKVINGVEARGDSILVIGNETWLKDNAVDYGIYDRLGVVFTAPTYISLSNAAFVDFRKKFLSRHGSFPSTYDNYAKIGFDFMFEIGELFNEYGADFFEKLKTADFKGGILSQGYNFKQANNNQVVPFIRITEGELSLLKK